MTPVIYQIFLKKSANFPCQKLLRNILILRHGQAKTLPNINCLMTFMLISVWLEYQKELILSGFYLIP